MSEQSTSNDPIRIVVVDDGEDYIELCHTFLKRYHYLTNCDFSHPCWECELESGCTLKHAHDFYELEALMGRYSDEPDVVLLDLDFSIAADRLIPREQADAALDDPRLLKRLQARQGISILAALRERWGALPVVLMTSKRNLAHDDPALVAQLEEHRFTEMFDDGGVNAQALAGRIESLVRTRRAAGPAAEDERFFWGEAPAMQRLRAWLEVFAQGDQPMLILGETGTGKSYLAEHFVHSAARPRGPFCALDLAAIPEDLIAAELFGTSRGAFSDAVDRAGRFEFANGGTLFLDEIGNLSLETQKRLLTVLQERRVTRLGENRARPIDVKLVVATNEDLEALVRAGRFRADLYQRLNPAAKVVIPPLRDRLDDLPELLQVLTQRLFESPGNRKLLSRFARLFGLGGTVEATVQTGRRARPGRGVTLQLAGAAEKTIRAASWPGNVRQLDMVWTNAVTYQLTEQLAAGRVGDSPVIPLDAQLLQELIRSSSVGEGEREAAPESEPERVVVEVSPAATLNALSRAIEVQVFRELYIRSGERFDRMASRMLDGDLKKNARRVQLRFNNLGLSTRKMRQESKGSGGAK